MTAKKKTTEEKPKRTAKAKAEPEVKVAEPIPAPAEITEASSEPEVEVPKSDRYFEAVGRRKTAVARVRLYTRGDMATVVNERVFQEYFPTMELQRIVEDPMKRLRTDGRFRVSVKVKGGGIHAQAEATRMGIARALTIFNPEFRKRLKKAGFLRRDPRAVERKKFGLKKARRAPQWQKR